MPARRARDRTRDAEHEPAEVHGCSPSTSLSGSISSSAASSSICGGVGCCTSMRVDRGVVVERVDRGDEIGLRARRRAGGRAARSCRPRPPSPASCGCSPRSAPSSPTRIVPRPGVMPRSTELLDARLEVGERRLRDRGARHEDRAHQWRKCRSPVNTIASPSSSAFSMMASSRIEPPGWITAATPAPRPLRCRLRTGRTRRSRTRRRARGRRPSSPRSRPTRPGSADRRRSRRPARPSRARSRSTSRARRCARRARGRATAPAWAPTFVTDAPVVARRREVVRRLHEEAARDLPEVERARPRGRAPRGCGCSCASSGALRSRRGVTRRDHDVGLRSCDHPLDGRRVDRPVQRDDAAERGPLVALERALVRGREVARRAPRRTGWRA